MSDPFEKVRVRLAAKAVSVRALLANPVGEDVLKILEDEFLTGELFVNDPYRTAFNLGGREVVAYLKRLATLGEKNELG